MGNVRLANFLIELAIDDDLRSRFSKDPEGTLNSLEKPLVAEARKAILEANGPAVFKILGVNNQNNTIARKQPSRKRSGTGRRPR
jgi:hypothetical protein